MATTNTRPADDDTLTADDHAVIERALAEPGITLTADALAELIGGLDDEVRELIVAGRVAEGLAVARFNAFGQQYRFAQRDHIARIRGA